MQVTSVHDRYVHACAYNVRKSQGKKNLLVEDGQRTVNARDCMLKAYS